MSKGQRRARDKVIRQRAASRVARRRIRQAARRAGAAATVTAVAIAGWPVAPAGAAEGAPYLVADINPGSGPSSPETSVSLGGALYFVANDGVHGHELWRSDGTTAGTSLVKDLRPGDMGSYPAALTVLGSTLYFGADGRLWKSDGSSAGTVEVTDQAAPETMVVFRGALYFGDERGRLWRSEGTAPSTTLVADIAPKPWYPHSSAIEELTVVGDALYFAADDRDRGRELWTSDGTADGTVLVKDIDPRVDTSTDPDDGSVSTDPKSSYPQSLTAVGDLLYFSADDGEHGRELWRSDGTATGTTLVKDLAPGTFTGTNSDGTTYVEPKSSRPSALTALGGTLFFGASGQESGLWRSDGTSAGTVQVTDVTVPNDMTAGGGTLYFGGWSEDTGEELWKSDGTAAGTRLLQDLAPGNDPSYNYPYPNSSSPRNLAIVDRTLYFTAYPDDHGNELWALSLDGGGRPGTPGTPAGSASCPSATQSATAATAAVKKAKKRLAKAKKSHSAPRIKKARKKLKKAKAAAAAAKAAQAAACG